MAWGKYVSVTFFFTFLYISCRVFRGSFLATTITLLTAVSCYYMTSFNYGGKKTRDVGLTCKRHLGNVMHDGIFYDSMGSGITLLLFFLRRNGNCCLPQNRRNWFSLITITPLHLGKSLAKRDCGRWDRLSFTDVSLLEHVWGFQSWHFIEGLFCSSMFSSFKLGMLRFWPIQPTW